MPRARCPVPNVGAPAAMFNTGDDAPAAISDTGLDLLHSPPISPYPAMASGGGSWTDLISDETDVNAFSLSTPLDDLGSTQTKVVKPKRARNYTHEEDVQLCKSWENISTDPITANEQPGKAYWKRIADHFHKHKTFKESDRNANSLEHRWSTIQKDCMRFQALYEDVERSHPSGVPHQELILRAQALFAKPPENKTFHFLHCWLQVRHCQKFITIETNKRPRSRSATPSEGATEEEGNGSGRREAPDSTQPRPEKRPIGRKQAKDRLKTGGDAGPYKEAIEELILDKQVEKKLRVEERQLKQERWQEEKRLREERWKETKMMQENKISLEREKLLWEQEQKIMFCDVSTLDQTQKAYVLAMRAKIAEQKMAAFNGSFGNGFDGGLGTSSGGSGGDIDGAA